MLPAFLRKTFTLFLSWSCQIVNRQSGILFHAISSCVVWQSAPSKWHNNTFKRVNKCGHYHPSRFSAGTNTSTELWFVNIARSRMRSNFSKQLKNCVKNVSKTVSAAMEQNSQIDLFEKQNKTPRFVKSFGHRPFSAS